MTPEEAIEPPSWSSARPRTASSSPARCTRPGGLPPRADMARRWAALVRPVVTGISHAELEQRRWGPGGRAHFADPRPGDFPRPGRQATSEPDTEMEAG